MTSIFKNYRALVVLTKNLEKLGVSNEIVTKAMIQSIGEMDSMMGEYLKKTQKEVDKEDKTTPGDVFPDESDSDDAIEEEEEMDSEENDDEKPVQCKYCGKRNEKHPLTHFGKMVNGKHQRGEFKWLIHDLYLLKDNWLIVATPNFGPYIIVRKSYGLRKCDFEIRCDKNKSYEFWNWGNIEESKDQDVPILGIRFLTSKEAKIMETAAGSTYAFLRGLKYL